MDAPPFSLLFSDNSASSHLHIIYMHCAGGVSSLHILWYMYKAIIIGLRLGFRRSTHDITTVKQNDMYMVHALKFMPLSLFVLWCIKECTFPNIIIIIHLGTKPHGNGVSIIYTGLSPRQGDWLHPELQTKWLFFEIITKHMHATHSVTTCIS